MNLNKLRDITKEIVINDTTPKKLTEHPRVKTLSFVRSSSFVAADPLPRRITSFARIEELEVLKKGQKVRLREIRLDEPIKLKIPDPQNTNVTIEKVFPLSDIMQRTNLSLNAITQLGRQISLSTNQNSAENIKKTEILISLISKLLTTAELMSPPEIQLISDVVSDLKTFSIDKLDIPDKFDGDWFANDKSGVNIEKFKIYLIHNDIPEIELLSKEYPAFGISGSPILRRTVVNNIRSGEVFLKEGRRLFRSWDSLNRILREEAAAKARSSPIIIPRFVLDSDTESESKTSSPLPISGISGSPTSGIPITTSAVISGPSTISGTPPAISGTPIPTTTSVVSGSPPPPISGKGYSIFTNWGI